MKYNTKRHRHKMSGYNCILKLFRNSMKSVMAMNRKKGCMYGLAIGDAMGAPVEFIARGTFEPVTEYRSGGKFRLEAGEWTDDTAMALCLAQSLIDSNGFDPHDQLDKYLKWIDEGYMSCNGRMIGLGKVCMRSLVRYRRTKQPYTDITHEKFSGNGSLMRLAPVCIYYAGQLDKAIHLSAQSSKTTHGSPVAVDACRYFAYLIVRLLQGIDISEIFSNNFRDEVYDYFMEMPLHKSLSTIVDGEFRYKNVDKISSSGYVVHSLEAALWSFYHSDSFEEAVLKAVNLGDDADTVGAITGQLAGAYYGIDSIPKKWITELRQKDRINTVFDTLCKVI